MFSFIDLNDFSLKDVKSLIYKADEIKNDAVRFSNCLTGRILASLFFEFSTRTQFSFQSAMFKLGGQVLGFSSPGVSSISKGESFADTIRVMSSYVDVLTIRHSYDGAARAASLFSKCPVINAGDGIHLHPTQTLADLLTIYQLKHKFSNLVIGVCGDLRFGRPVNSLVRMLCRFENNRFIFISNKELKISNFLRNFIETSSNCSFVECDNLEQVISNLDVLYMTRVQKERFKNLSDYEKQKDSFQLTLKILNLAKSDLVVLHPLPRINEISCEVDDDCRSAYFLQAENGVYGRMALILKLLAGDFFESKEINLRVDAEILKRVCCNENCISRFEPNLPNFFLKKDGFFICAYCDERIE